MAFSSILLFAAEAAHGEDHGPSLLGLNAEGWVYTGITIFILIAVFYVKAHRKLIDGLDARIAETRRELDEAAQLRTEAEAVLAEAKSQQAGANAQAQALIATAEADAANMLIKAEADAKDLIARRTRMAEDSIAAAERTAVADVRASAVNLSAGAARALLAAQHDAKADARLIDGAIAQLN